MPKYEVTLKPGEAMTVAAIRETVPTIEQMPERCSAMFDAIGRWLAANHLTPGPTMTTYYNEGFTRENIDTECAFVLTRPDVSAIVKPEGKISIRQIEAAPLLASTIVTDDFYKKVDGLTPAYTALAQWIESNGYQIVGPPRELFYGSPRAGDLTAEVQFPVVQA